MRGKKEIRGAGKEITLKSNGYSRTKLGFISLNNARGCLTTLALSLGKMTLT